MFLNVCSLAANLKHIAILITLTNENLYTEGLLNLHKISTDKEKHLYIHN